MSKIVEALKPHRKVRPDQELYVPRARRRAHAEDKVLDTGSKSGDLQQDELQAQDGVNVLDTETKSGIVSHEELRENNPHNKRRTHGGRRNKASTDFGNIPRDTGHSEGKNTKPKKRHAQPRKLPASNDTGLNRETNQPGKQSRRSKPLWKQKRFQKVLEKEKQFEGKWIP
ncbi:MAG: hypothetical protein L6R39_001857 [Caloplaca ligustica]|nr:MAG: hypothetical protein L6R39_001857 [Caloplaca ligustica]